MNELRVFCLVQCNMSSDTYGILQVFCLIQYSMNSDTSMLPIQFVTCGQQTFICQNIFNKLAYVASSYLEELLFNALSVLEECHS